MAIVGTGIDICEGLFRPWKACFLIVVLCLSSGRLNAGSENAGLAGLLGLTKDGSSILCYADGKVLLLRSGQITDITAELERDGKKPDNKIFPSIARNGRSIAYIRLQTSSAEPSSALWILNLESGLREQVLELPF